MGTWSIEDIDSLEGKTCIITGGTSGIGKEAAKVLTQFGASVIIASDDLAKGQKVLEELKADIPKGNIVFEKLDLGSRASINSFCDRVMQDHPTVDILINNAGLAGIPKRSETIDGHEMIFGVNYLGHFILTAQLFPMIMRSTDPRVIFLSSIEHKEATLNFEDLDYHTGYQSSQSYAQSKLAMLMFAFELHRRCTQTGVQIKSIPVHPGASSTHIFDRGAELTGQGWHPRPMLKSFLIKALGQKPESGALPILFAATSIEARSGIYYGPDGMGELWGSPREAKVALPAENMLAARKLWEESERLSGIRFNVENSRSIGLH